MKKVWDVLISKGIVEGFFTKLLDNLELDVAVVGAGPSGLVAAYELAKAGYKTAIFEERNVPGGGIWGGGMMFNEIILEQDLEDCLNELQVHYRQQDEHIIVDSVHFASALIYNTTKKGVVIFNNVTVEDVAVHRNRVCGVVVNWGPVRTQKLHVDPITVKSNFVVDSTGHPANVVNLLARRGLLEVKVEFPMNAETAEKFVVDNTREIYPGLLVSGMAATAVHGGPRMGPIFGGMVLSGLKIAKIVSERLGEKSDAVRSCCK